MATNKKVTELAAASTITTDDLLVMVDAPGTTPGSQKITFDNLQLAITKVGTIVTGVWTGTTIAVANGGTGDTGTAWTSYNPTVTAVAGSITSYTATGFYKQLGKTVRFRCQVTITNAGTSSSGNDITLPVTAKDANQPFAFGAENGITGKGLVVLPVSTTVMRVRFYDATFAGATSNAFVITGVYESA